MIIDIGGGTTDIAVISMAGTVYGRSLRVAGNALDEAIMQYMRKRVQPAHRRAHGRADQVRGRIGGAARPAADDGSQGTARCSKACRAPCIVSDTEIREALAEPLRKIVQAVRDCARTRSARALRRHLRSRRRPHQTQLVQ